MAIKAKCDKCNCTDFCVVELGIPELRNASDYFGQSRVWWERELHGVHKYRAMCKGCGEIFDWSKDYNLPVMD